MWVLTQDLKKLVQCEGIFVKPLYPDYPEPPQVFRTEKGLNLGIYTNHANAETVMNSFVSHIQNQYLLQQGKARIFGDDEIRANAVFIMPRESFPEEEEVPLPPEPDEEELEAPYYVEPPEDGEYE